MASINTIVKRKQYLWLGIVVVGTASAIGGALYLSDVDMSGNGETVAEQEPVPDMTGVVDTTFDDKVRQHATTEMQVTAAQMQKQYEEIRRELDVLNKQRGDDQRRIEKLGQDNAALAEQVKALGANPVTATGEPVPQMPASPPGPEGEPQPGNTPVSFPPQGSVAVPPPTAFYPGNGVTPPPQVTYQSVPVPNRIQRKVFIRIGDLPIIRPRSRQWWQLFRMVSQWHVDVVIVERRSFSIVAAVELDDASHLRPERRRRDILLEEVMRQAGIPLLRSHDARKLLQMTGEWLNTTGADQQSPEHRS